MTNPRLEELRAKFQENPRRYFAPYANELRKAGDPAQAIAVCRTHLASQPGHVSGHIVLGQALYEAGEGNEARDIFTAALELDPENLIALRSLGEIAQVNGDFASARQWYQRLLDADPRNSEVTQLLRDIPADAPPKPIVIPETASHEEPTPFTVREEIAAAEAPSSVPEPSPAPSAPTVHTGFTGQGPAYKTAEDEREEDLARQSQPAPAAEREEAFIDLQPTAHDRGMAVHDDASEPASASAEMDPMEFVDIGEDSDVFAPEAAAMPDESFDFVEESSADYVADTSLDTDSEFAPEANNEQVSAAAEAATDPPSDFVTDETYTRQAPDHIIPSLEIEDFAADALTPNASNQPATPDETTEPPRAVFAERGFDSSVDEIGWMTTPSQAFSDLEAAPEDWLEEIEEETPAAASETSVPGSEAGASQPPESDSWFDEVAGVGAAEPNEATSDELWLPPELPQVTNAEDNAPRPQELDVAAQATTDSLAWSASTDEVQAMDAAPNAELEWSQPVEPASQDEVEVSAEHPDHVQAETSYAPDEPGEPVGVEPAHDAYAAAESFTADESSFDVQAAETSETTAAAEEPASPPELEPPQLSEMPEFVYASEAPSVPSSGAMGQTPSEAVSAPTPAPFLTETLAELYLQQGFRDEALAIYQQLLDRNPTNEALKARMVALQQAEVSPPSQVPAEARAASQSVRTFFSRLARRPAAAAAHVTRTPSGGSGGGSDEGEGRSHLDVPFSAAASPLANLFPASKPPQSDEGAASMLAGAFTDPAGRPSRAAERELSLDHLFRDVAPGGPAGGTGGVTLDEFYSAPNSGTGSTTESGSEAGAEDPSGTDIRQFTAWLEGLRKK
jgi:cytochrome c-type biogenesis protein CcmH/NrfG